MVANQPRGGRRRGATAVETAFVILPVILITVTVSGNYVFLNLPLLHMPTVSMSSACTMVCEGVR